MTLTAEYIKIISAEKIKSFLNSIVCESDSETRKKLCLELHALDMMHTMHEYGYNKPLVVFTLFIYQTYNMRDPTNEEYEEFYYNQVEKLKYKYNNFAEYIKDLQKTDLRKVISQLYFEEDIATRLSLVQAYNSKRNKRVIRGDQPNKKQYYIDRMKDKGVWSIDGRRKLRDTPKKELQEWAQQHLGICEA